MKKSLDRHLNLFWNYSGNAGKEDNMTRALINTLEFLEEGDKISFIKYILEKFEEKNEEVRIVLKELGDFDMEDIKVKFDLQNPYINVKDEKCLKLLMGLNPSGETWDEDFYDFSKKLNFDEINENVTNNKASLKKYLKEELNKEILEENMDTMLESFRIRKNRGGSRPDGWIFIHIENELKLIIAVESKLWDLDPYQLDNHLEKCLGVEDKKEAQYIFKFNEICEQLKQQQIKDKTIKKIIRNFLEYMELNGYYINTDPFKKEDILGIKGIAKKEWERIINSEEEIKKEVENRNKILGKKWGKYFEKYFESREWERLAKEEDLEKDKTHQWVNFVGFQENIYFDIEHDPTNNFAFFMSLEMGQKNYWRAKEIRNNIKIDQISELNDKELENLGVESKYQILKRLNSLSYSEYFSFSECYTDLKECLNQYKEEREDKFYIPNLNRDQCLQEIKKLDENLNLDWIKEIVEKSIRGKVDPETGKAKSHYNLLSYLRFIDYVDYENIHGKNEDQMFELFSKMIKKHCNVVKTLNNSI